MVNQLRSRRYDLFRRLTQKLLIEDEEASVIPPAIARLVSPVIDVSQLLIDERAIFANGDLTASAGATITYHTVPVGERWHLRWFVREIATGTTRVLISKVVDNLAVSITALATGEQRGTFEGIKIDSGDSVDLVTSGNGADGSISLILLYGRELLG